MQKSYLTFVFLILSALFVWPRTTHADFSAPKNFSPVAGSPVHLKSVREFRALSTTEQNKYINTIQKIIVDIELTQRKSIDVAKTNPFINLLIDAAEAARLCSVGGVFRQIHDGKCPTFGRSCGTGDNFLCGNAFGNACVSREDIQTLSSRCYDEAQKDENKAKAREKYDSSKDKIEALFNENCVVDDKSPSAVGCAKLQAQLNNFKSPAVEAAPAAPPAPPAPVVAAPVAPPAAAPAPQTPPATKAAAIVPGTTGCVQIAKTPTPSGSCRRLPTNVHLDGATFDKSIKMPISSYQNTFTIVKSGLEQTYYLKDGHMCLKYTADSDPKKRAFSEAADINQRVDPSTRIDSMLDVVTGGKVSAQLAKDQKSRETILGACTPNCPEDKIRAECLSAYETFGGNACNNDKFKTNEYVNRLDELDLLDRGLRNVASAKKDFQAKGPLYKACIGIFSGTPDVCSSAKDPDLKALAAAVESSSNAFLNIDGSLATQGVKIARGVKRAAGVLKDDGTISDPKIAAQIDACLAPLSKCIADVGELAKGPGTTEAKEICSNPLPKTLPTGEHLDTIFDNKNVVGYITTDGDKILIQSIDAKHPGTFGAPSIEVELKGDTRVITSHGTNNAIESGRIVMPLYCQTAEAKQSDQMAANFEIDGYQMSADKSCGAGTLVRKVMTSPDDSTSSGGKTTK